MVEISPEFWHDDPERAAALIEERPLDPDDLLVILIGPKEAIRAFTDTKWEYGPSEEVTR